MTGQQWLIVTRYGIETPGPWRWEFWVVQMRELWEFCLCAMSEQSSLPAKSPPICDLSVPSVGNLKHVWFMACYEPHSTIFSQLDSNNSPSEERGRLDIRYVGNLTHVLSLEFQRMFSFCSQIIRYGFWILDSIYFLRLRLATLLHSQPRMLGLMSWKSKMKRGRNIGLRRLFREWHVQSHSPQKQSHKELRLSGSYT